MSFLKKITIGAIKQAFITLIYGVAGVGKTSCAVKYDSNCLVIDFENGSLNLDVARVQKEHLPDYASFLRIIDELLLDCPYDTIVVDSLSRLADLMKDEVLAEYKVKSLNKIGYGGGTVAMVERTEKLMNKFIELKDKGINVILIAHSKIKTFNDPAGESFSRYNLSIPDQCADKIRELSDNVLFATYKYFQKDEKRAVSNGERVLLTEWRPAHEAKSRLGLPYEIPLDGKELRKAIELCAPKTAEELKSDIDGLMSNLKDPAVLEKINAAIEKAGVNVDQLLPIKQRVQELAQTQLS